MKLSEVTLFGQSYIVYMALIMIALVAMKSIPMPKRVGRVLVSILLAAVLALLVYVLYQVFNGGD